MTISQKYKLGDLAKDLGMKSGELIELLAKNGYAGRKLGTQLDAAEFDVVVNAVTASRQIENIDDYLSGKISITVPKPAPSEAAESVSAPQIETAAVKPVEPQPSELKNVPVQEPIAAPVAQTRPETINTTESQINIQPQAQQQVQDQNQQQGQRPQVQVQNQQQGQRPQGQVQNQQQGQRPQGQGQNQQGQRPQGQGQNQQQGQRSQGQGQNQQQGQRPQGQGQNQQQQGQRPQGQGQNQQQQGQRPQGQGQNQQQGQRPQGQGQNQQQGQRPQGQGQQQQQGQRPQGQGQGQQQQQGQRPQGQGQGQQQQQGQRPQGQQAQGQRQPDRGQQQLNAVNAQQAKAAAEAKAKADERAAARDAVRDAKFEKKPDFSQQKPKPKPQKPAVSKPVQPAIVHSADEPAVSIIETRSQHRGKASETRVIDTRTTNVDLAKYDEKLDTFVPDSAKNMSGEKQKLKKQNNRPAPGDNRARSRINNAEAEKLKRLEQLEKAKKRQLQIILPDEILVGELASRLKVTAAAIIKKLIGMGFMATVNQTLDYETAALVAEEMGAKVTREVVVTIEEKLFDAKIDNDENLVSRPPVVVVMGHVDHGKTSLLDAIRHTNVTEGEAGGITQHIGAYRVNINGRDITFLDTPGHEAFTAMRARGAKATDIAILVVAADDGIMPQTVEAINHAKAAGLDIIVAINKMDKPGADPERVKQDLTKYDLVPEEWGGDVICVPVSAVTGKGIPDLLESVLLVAEVKDLRANPNRRAKGIIIEAKLDRGRGPVATVLIQNGTLNYGDVVIAGTAVGRVRAMTDDKGVTVKIAGPSDPVEIIGLAEVPAAGDEFNAVEDERMARELAEQRRTRQKEDEFKANSKVNLDDLFAQISEGNKELNIIVKGDVDGSAEAVKTSLLKLSTDEVKVKIIHSAVGGITDGDVMLAAASNAIIVGFNVRPDKGAIDSAERQKVDIRTYRIIYECIEEITAALKGMLAPTYKESLLGHAQVRQVIRVPKVGTIAGSYVQDGKITRSAKIRVLRDGVVIFEDQIGSLRRFKDDVKEVAAGYECGIGLERFNDLKENDILEAYEMVEVTK